MVSKSIKRALCVGATSIAVILSGQNISTTEAVKMCYEYGIVYHKTILGHHKDVKSYKDCQQLCYDFEPCEYFSYFGDSKTCILTDLHSLYFRETHKPGVSGPRTCINYKASFDLGGEFTKDVVRVLPPHDTISVEHCQMRCFLDKICNFFSYNTATQVCKFLGSFDGSGRVDEVNTVSGPKQGGERVLHYYTLKK